MGLGRVGLGGTGDGGEDGGHSVEVVNAAGVVQADLVLEEGADVGVAQRGQNPRQRPCIPGVPRPSSLLWTQLAPMMAAP